MKALTIRQPWASLCVEPGEDGRAVKWIETRTRPTKHRGRLAIHAAAHDPDRRPKDGPMLVSWRAAFDRFDHGDGLPTAVVIGSVDLVDCLQINPPGNEPKTPADWMLVPHLRFICRHVGDSLTFYEFGNGGSSPATRADDVTDQFSLGDFTDGRWAWIFANPRKCESVPAKGKLGLWNWDGEA